MSVLARLGLFAVAVLAAFGIGTAIGAAAGPIDVRDAPAEHQAPSPDEPDGPHPGAHDG